MIRLKRWVKNFFGLSHAQVNGFVILIPLLAIILFSEPVWHWYVSHQEEDFSGNRAKLDSLIALWETKTPKERADSSGVAPGITDLFVFDPNNATVEELVALGFSSTLSARIARYREKGGKFTIKADLLKIYGIDTSFFRQRYAFIDLPEKSERKEKAKEYSQFAIEKSSPDLMFDLNQADTSQLKKIFGIGDRLSMRIVKYRDALGGFTTFDQVREVYGLDSAVIDRLINSSFLKDDFQPTKININTADETAMATHPYIRKAAARAIVAYRFQHGEFEALDDLRKIHALDDETIQKIAPYLTLGD
ncbi:MAG: helix-hairpin-helix domain-containing protein [Cyclobacteriaceae bacterium]|jgi:competence protein ComEA|nr:helix-hairpin-helix domain-containing protein [Cyclobacteriaceae bacterium]MDH4294748.1 helix-hairpin-helix domain-containing protein [Cyclobacteriaceae bacterium]MDH5248597.1 helix-hairpin-helix domain-containing protein [Cyclobacteriaceae bacterium]